MIVCQHSNIEFEGNKRAKQHPLVAEFKNEAHKRGDYRLAMEALDKAAEIGGYSSIEEYMKLVTSIYAGEYDKKVRAENQRRQAEKERENARREARARREAQNRHLREHGYKWHKVEADDGQYGFGELGHEWVLIAPDGREVTVEQALDEIERGADVVLAEIEAARNAKAAEEKAKAEAEEQEQERYLAARDTATAGKVEVEAFEYDDDDFEVVYDESSKLDGGGVIVDRIYIGEINGIKCAVVYHYFGGHDYDEQISYYCSDPTAAGLEPVDNYHRAAAFFR